MYCILWQFTVDAGARERFEATYGPRGDWAQLFARAEGYVDTALLRDRSAPGRYVTIDRWTSRQAFEAFKRDFAAPYAELDRRCESLTQAEQPLGNFELVGTV